MGCGSPMDMKIEEGYAEILEEVDKTGASIGVGWSERSHMVDEGTREI